MITSDSHHNRDLAVNVYSGGHVRGPLTTANRSHNRVHRIRTPAPSPSSSEGTATNPISALDASSRCAGRIRTV